MDKSSFFSSLGGYLKANRAFFLIVVFILLATGGYFWWQAGFSLDFNRFFAAEPPTVVINSSLPLKHGDRLSVSWSATGATGGCDSPSWIATGGRNEGTAQSAPIDACTAPASSDVWIVCDFGGGVTSEAKQSFTVDKSTCPSSAKHYSCVSNTCTEIAGAGSNDGGCTAGNIGTACGGGGGGGCTAPSISAGARECHTDSKTGVEFCIMNTSTFASGTCSNANGGVLKQVVKIRNCSPYNGYIQSGGFNDPVAGCGATQAGGFTVDVSGGNIAANDSGTVTFTYNSAGMCGRAQVDACFHGDGFGGGPGGSACLDTDQWNILGKVINGGTNCATPTHLVCTNNACVKVNGAGGNEGGCTVEGAVCGTPVCSATAPTNLAAGSLSGGSATLAWIPGTGGTTQMLYVGPNQADVTAGCPTSTCIVKEVALPITATTYNVTGLVAGTTYYWRVVNFHDAACLKDAAASFTTPTSTTHMACSGMTCAVVQGAGENTCATDPDCWRLTCTNNACVKVAGTGENDAGCTTEGGTCGSVTNQLLCKTVKSRVNVNEVAQFTAEKGDGMYVWFAPTGIDAASTAVGSFSVKYTQPGFKTVTVASGGNHAVCTVTVLEPVVSSPPPSALACAPTTQTVGLNAYATVNATGGSGAFTWATPNGTKDPATNCVNTATCRVSYSAAGTYDVTVSDQQPGSTQTAVCKVVVASANQLLCAPTSQTVEVGDRARFDASGTASGSYSWSAPSGSPASASGASFETSYGSKGSYTVTVTSGTRTATCTVEATKGGGGSYTHTVCRNNTCTRVNGQGTSECSPEGSSCGSSSSPRLTLTKLVRNIAQGSGEADSVTANPTDTVEFSLRVSSNGSGTARSVTIRDSLPAGLTYVPGSTTIDSVAASDGLISSGLSLGDMQSGRTITIRFRATVSPASFFSSGTSVLTNTGYARGSNVPEVSDSAFVTVMNAKNLNISLTKMGRNITRGETGERSPVRSSPAQTIEFVMHVRNTSANPLNNVIIRDILPQEITLVAGSVRVGGVVAADVLTAAGLSLGTLTPGQEVVVMFSGLVASESQLPSGNTTVINTATVIATGIPMLSAQLPIVITNGIVIPPVETGPGETTVLALIISAIITLLYVGYTSTETYRRREATDIAKDSRGGMSDFNT